MTTLFTCDECGVHCKAVVDSENPPRCLYGKKKVFPIWREYSSLVQEPASRSLDIVVKPYDSLPCSCEVFTINGMAFDMCDFVESEDANPEDAEPYGCGNHIATPLGIFTVRKNLDATYKGMIQFSDEEIERIQEKLCDALHVGHCGWCI
jgi:hypothetical protein